MPHYNYNNKLQVKLQLHSPSPNPKQGIKLSSSKGDRVRPIMEIACSYGLGVPEIAWRLLLLNENFPAPIKA